MSSSSVNAEQKIPNSLFFNFSSAGYNIIITLMELISHLMV